MKEIRILFTGVGRRIELLQAFRTAALVQNKQLKLYGADLTGTAPALAYCDFTRKVVPMKDPSYIDALLDICQQDAIDLIIPTIDTDLLVLAENKERFEAQGTKVLISAPEMIRICRDKRYTSQFFVDCGLAAPMPVDDWRKYDAGFPAFIKPKDGSSSINAFKVESIEALETYANQVDDYIVQPFVSGREYTIDIFCDWDGNPLSIVPRERVQVRAGEVLKTQICLDSTMIKEAEALCKAFRPCGPMTVQLIRDDATGVDYFIEINPRFGGGAPLSMKAGARSAEALLKLLGGESVMRYEDGQIEDGAVYSRFDQSVRITSGITKPKGVIFDLDDTLYNEKAYVKSGFEAVAEYLGEPYYQEVLWHSFMRGERALDLLLTNLGRLGELDRVLQVYRSHVPKIVLNAGVKGLLSSLKEGGIKIGVITDGRPEGQRNKIQALGLLSIIDDLIITDELGGEQFRKPCDIAFRILQTKWRLNPEEIAYVGDNVEKDFQAPQRLGMKCIHYKNVEGIYCQNEQKTMNNAHLEIAHNFLELKTILKGDYDENQTLQTIW